MKFKTPNFNPVPYYTWVDSEKDLKAAKGRVRSGFSSRTQEVAELGNDVEELELEIADDNKRADGLGLVFDSDGRKTDNSGKFDEKQIETDQ